MTSDPLVERFRSDVLRILNRIPGRAIPAKNEVAAVLDVLHELLIDLNRVAFAAGRDPLNMSHLHLSWDPATHTVRLIPAPQAPGWLKELWSKAFDERETDNG